MTTTSKVRELEDPFGLTFAPTAFIYNKAYKGIMKHFSWKRAAVLYDFIDEGGFYVDVSYNSMTCT